jgi:hypothetical protein
MLNYQRKLALASLSLIYWGMYMVAASAQTVSVSTVPSGYFTLTIPAGFGNSSSISVLSFPLQGIGGASGQMAGIISGITANTITNSNAVWTASQLSVPATPYLLQITSGTAAGRTFLLSTTVANTSTTVTLDPNDSIKTPDLTTLGIVTGTDTYQIIPADTISGLFGTPATTGIVGGAGSSTNADLITVSTSGWNGYYYDTNSNHWLRLALPHTQGDNIVIRPDSGVIFNRFGTSALTITVAGQVPSVARQSLVANSGVTLFSNNWPVDQTLGTSNIQNLPGWISGSSASTSDTVVLFNSVTGWRLYYYNGTHWIWSNPSHAISDSIVIPAGSIGYITKQGATSGYAILTQNLPYSLN